MRYGNLNPSHLLVKHKLPNVLEDAAFFLVAALADHLEEVMDIHALVNIKEERH